MGAPALELTESIRLSILKEAFSVPWEVDVLASPICKDREDTSSGVEDTQVVSPSSLAKSLIRRGFFGPRAVSPSLVVLKEVILSSKGKDPIPEFGLIRRGFLGSGSVSPSLPVVSSTSGVAELGLQSPAAASLPSSHVCTSFSTISLSDGAAMMESRRESGIPIKSFVSMSQLWYTRWVKEKVAKQLNKNKDLLAEAVGDIPLVGEDRVLNALNLALVLGLSWGGEDNKLRDLFSVIDKREPMVEASAPKAKGLRELKNLDCSISPVKGQRRRGWLGSKNAFSFPPKLH